MTATAENPDMVQRRYAPARVPRRRHQGRSWDVGFGDWDEAS
jgi:hypothetical protein